jgi:protein-S-isoprenylcysteine O-methyltransferase Ste14
MAAGSSRWSTVPYLISGATVIGVSFFVDERWSLLPEVSRYSGLALVFLGLGMVFWATAVGRDAVLGEIEPNTEKLVQAGPFGLVRHPMYLGFSAALLGVTLSARSWPGLICVFLLFLPSAIYRAKMEERALARKFGEGWKHYASKVGFMLPGVPRN